MMDTVWNSAGEVVAFLCGRGFCPVKVAENRLACEVLVAWSRGVLSGEGVVRALENLEVLGGVSFREEVRDVNWGSRA